MLAGELLHVGSTWAKATGRTQPLSPQDPVLFQTSALHPRCSLQLQTFKATLSICSMATKPVPLHP